MPKRRAAKTPAARQAEVGAPSLADHLAILLVSAGTLLLQLAFLRIFSASIWYHFAFLIVSIALFGFGASGAALSLLPVSPREPRLRALAPALFGATAIGAYLGTVAVPFSPFTILQQPVQMFYFLLYVLFLLVPFFFSGATVALILRAWPARAGSLYACDLVGAACGPLLLFVALPVLGARGTVVLAALFGGGAALLLSESVRTRIVVGLVTALMVPLLLVPTMLPDLRPDATKGVTQALAQGGRLVRTVWDPLARVDVVEHTGLDPMLFIDAAAATPVSGPVTPERARADLSTLAFQLASRPTVAIIGSGGGTDVQNALALGARQVTAVEINGVIVDLVSGPYARHAAGVFQDPRVRLVHDEGRSFLERAPTPFGVIALTLIDTWAASVSGAFSLTENYLYTTEGMATFLDHIEPDGFLAITRWYYEAPRLVVMLRHALASMGIPDAARHVAVVEERVRTIVIVKRQPFSAGEVAVLRARVRGSGWVLAHDPGSPEGKSGFGALLLNPRPDRLDTEQGLLLTPPSDDSPFFFQMTQWRRLIGAARLQMPEPDTLQPLAAPVGQIVLLAALGIGVLLSCVLLAVPILAGAVPRMERWTWWAYFFCLGVAYILVEVVLMQRLALFLGHPTYSVTAVLFAILLFSGLGSAWSATREIRWLSRALRWGLPLAIAFVAFAIPPILRALLFLPLPARLGVAVALLAPTAFAMGMPFPLGMRLLATRTNGLVPWGWAANGCGSVLGSVAAVLGSMVASFTAMLALAGLIYGFAMARIAARRSTS